MENRPLISVIVPVYNIMDCLERCVHSICSQTYENLEILLVDDGSTDGTELLCETLQKEDSRIRVFHKENGGSSSARNYGISKAQGAYFGFVDSDDYIAPGMYEKLYTLMESESRKNNGATVQIAQVAREEVAADGTILPAVCFQKEYDTLYTSQEFLQELLMHRGDCSFCTKLVARELFAEQQFPIGVLNEDFYLLVQLLQKTCGVASSPEKMYYVYYRIGSNTRKKSREEFSRVYGDCVDNADMVSEFVKKHFLELSDTALRFGVFQRLEYLLHIPINSMTKNNEQYKEIVEFLRKNVGKAMRNPYLTPKNKIYTLLFAAAPKSVRRIHKTIKKL